MKPIRAAYKPNNPYAFGYGVTGELIFAYSDCGWHKVVILLDEATAPKRYDSEEKFKFFSDHASDWEFDGDYYEAIKLWNTERTEQADERTDKEYVRKPRTEFIERAYQLSNLKFKHGSMSDLSFT